MHLQTLYRLFSTVIPLGYLSHSSTNYFFGIPEVPLSSVGEGPDRSLVCHTDSTACCRQLDSGMEGGVGDWYYPNGSAINADNSTGSVYVSRGHRNMSLNYNRQVLESVAVGLYCCVIPTSQGTQTSCAILQTAISPQRPDASSTCSGTVTIGSVVALMTVMLIVLGVVITTCLALRHKKRGEM